VQTHKGLEQLKHFPSIKCWNSGHIDPQTPSKLKRPGKHLRQNLFAKA